jgi:hypothetical protein
VTYSSDIFEEKGKKSIPSKLKGNPNFQLFGEVHIGDADIIIQIQEETSMEKHQKVPIPFENTYLNLRPVLNEKGMYRRLT